MSSVIHGAQSFGPTRAAIRYMKGADKKKKARFRNRAHSRNPEPQNFVAWKMPRYKKLGIVAKSNDCRRESLLYVYSSAKTVG